MTDALTALRAPADPREEWDLPPFGELPAVADLDPTTTRVLAPNPSPMTLDGTNTYVVGDPGGGDAVVLDPGPDADAHWTAVRDLLARRDLACRLVVATHHHADHAEAARAWAQRLGCRVAAARRDVAGEDGRLLADGDTVDAGQVSVRAVATPGHADDHLAFRLDHGPLLTGDHVLGRGTSVVAHPDGDLPAYLESLRRVLDLGPDVLYPGHGPELTEDVGAVVRYYLEHRRFRERQVVAVLGEGPHTPRQLVERIYADVPEQLWPAAELSTRAALDKLAAEGRVDRRDDTARLVT